MVNEVLLQYLKQHKDAYPADALKKEILSKGYLESDYNEALQMIHDQKFKPGEVSRLPTSHVVTERKKGMSKGKVALLIILIFLFGAAAFVLMNYFGMSLFGFNLFDYF